MSLFFKIWGRWDIWVIGLIVHIPFIEIAIYLPFNVLLQEIYNNIFYFLTQTFLMTLYWIWTDYLIEKRKDEMSEMW